MVNKQKKIAEAYDRFEKKMSVLRKRQNDILQQFDEQVSRRGIKEIRDKLGL